MYIDRPIFQTLYTQKDNAKVTILIGARQVGKTTLLRALFDLLKDDYPSLFLDLDLYSNYEKVNTYENLINTIKFHGYRETQEKPFFLFMDEFQRYADISMVLKNMADHHKNVKIYASGSSSLAINSNIQETLAGRKRTIVVYPLTFKEFLDFTGNVEGADRLPRLHGVRSRTLDRLLPDLYRAFDGFLVCGGYPEIARVNPAERGEVFESIFDLYIKKELVDYLNVGKIKNAKLLIQSLAVNNGCETKYSSLGQITGLDEKTVKNYIEILKETFLITTLVPRFTNQNREIVKMPKVYYLDNGVRNYFINNFNPPALRSDAPFLFEGYVISELIKKGVRSDAIKFWRTKNQMEVDVVLEHSGKHVPVEIKYKPKVSAPDLRGLKSYVSSYPKTERSFLVNIADNTELNGVRLLSPFDLDVLV